MTAWQVPAATDADWDALTADVPWPGGQHCPEDCCRQGEHCRCDCPACDCRYAERMGS